MLYDYLYEFSVVARMESLSKASIELSVSQPALGRHMASLEAEFGCKLLTRGPKGIRLTEDGRYALSVALDISEQGTALEKHFKERNSEFSTSRMVSIGGLTVSALGSSSTERALKTTAKLHPGIVLRHLANESYPSVRNALNAHETDIALIYQATLEQEQLSKDFHTTYLGKVGIDAFVEENHSLSQLHEIEIADLKDYPIGHVAGNFFNADAEWNEFKRVCSDNGFLPLSKTVGYEMAPSWGHWNLPTMVLVFTPDTHDNDALASMGKHRIRIVNSAFRMYAVAREDDNVTCDLLDAIAPD